MKDNKKPSRMCVACRRRGDKDSLLRIVRPANEMEARVDLLNKIQGRSAYICKKTECVVKAQKIRALPRNLKCDVREELYKEIMRLLEKD